MPRPGRATESIHNGRHEPVSPSVDGFNVAGLPGVIAEQPSNLPDGDLQDGVANMDIGPDGVEQLIFGDDPRPLPDEMEQHGQRFRGEMQRLAVLPEPFADRIHRVGPELQGFVTRHDCRCEILLSLLPFRQDLRGFLRDLFR